MQVQVKHTEFQNEEELVIALKQKNIQAFDYLYDNYNKALFGIIFKIIGISETSEDLLQDSFVKIWKNIESYDAEKGRLYTWMFQICRNTALNVKRNKLRETIQIEDSTVYDTKAYSVTMDSGLMAIGMDKWINKLADDEKRVLDLLYFQGFTHQEAADHLKIPLGTVKTRTRAALQKLRQWMN